MLIEKSQCKMMVSIESSSIPGMAPRGHETLALWGEVSLEHSGNEATSCSHHVRILAEQLCYTLKRDCNWIIPLGDLEAVLSRRSPSEQPSHRYGHSRTFQWV